MPEGNGVCTCYMHVLKSLSVLPPAGPLTTFGFSAIRRTLRRIWVETAVFFEKGQRLLLSIGVPSYRNFAIISQISRRGGLASSS